MKNVFIILFLFISSVVGATTYYVDPSGSNSNSGSSSSPWKTLAYACSKATNPGDIIQVNAGTFTETSQCVLAVGVSIVGQGGTSIIKSTYVATGANDAAIYLNSSSGTSTNGNQSISYITLDGNNLTSTRAIAVNFRNNVEIHHCTIQNFNFSGVSFNGSTSNYPTAVSTYHSTGNSFHDCTITNCSSMVGYPGGDFVGAGQTGLLVYNNIFDQTERAAGSNGDVWNASWLQGCKFYNNTLTRNDATSGYWSFFSELFFTEGGCEIYGNTFNGLSTLDIVDVRAGSYTFGLKIYNNNFLVAAQAPSTNEGIQAIDFEERGAVQNVYVYNNHFKNSNTAIQFDGLATSTDKTLIGGNIRMENLYVYYNLFENIGNTTNNSSSAIDLKPEGTLTNLVWNNIYIDNNTLVSGTTHKGYSGVLIETSSSMTNIYVRNNIIQGFASNAVLYSYNLGTPSGSTHYIQDNLFYSNGGNSVGFSGVSVSGIGYTPAGGYVSTSNPLFVSTTDFHLQTGSPAIGAGIHITTPAISTDYAGTALKNPPSLGAYETSSAAPAPTPVVPVYQSSAVANATPSLLEMTYSVTLANIVPAVSAFNVIVNSLSRPVSSVAISVAKVQLTLSSEIKYGDVVTVSYTKPSTNPVQSTTGGAAISIPSQSVTNNLINPTKDAAPIGVTMTISPNHVHRTLNILLAYSSTPSSSLSPEVIQITNLSGTLQIAKLLVTGVTGIKIPLNLDSGIYIVAVLGNGIQLASQKIIVY